jgi:ankyrin repeat protein
MASEAKERMCLALMHGDVAGVAAALLAGADPNALVGDWTPLHDAAAYGVVAAIDVLLAAGARLHFAGRHGFTALMNAALMGQTAAVDALLAAGANVHDAGENGNTVLHWASRSGHLDTARALLEAGARTDLRNKEGKRPIDVVRLRLGRRSLLLRARTTSACCPCAGVRRRGRWLDSPA